MTWNMTHTTCAAVLALVACDAEVDPGFADQDAPAIARSEENGVRLNSFRLNSFRLNSFRLNSFRLNGDPGTQDYIEITGVDLPGSAKAGFAWIKDSTLYMVTTKGKILGGAKLEKTIVRFTVQEDGKKSVREVKIEGVRPLEQGDDDDDPGHKHEHKHHPWHGDQADVMLYDLKIREGVQGKWAPLCVDEYGEAFPAVLLKDVWDPETGERVTPRPSGAVTLACVDAALGKCAVWGYRPWASVKGEPLADYHQACTRMVRADYCGDGVSYTQTGTPIHVLDELGIEEKSPDGAYAVEAEWSPDGAVCLNAANTRLPDLDVACELPACGADFASGGLIQSGKVVD